MRDEILEAREIRYNKIVDLIEKFDLPVLCGKLNYPGNNKNTKEVKIGFNILLELISDNFYEFLKHIEILNGSDGPSIIMVLNLSPDKAKRMAVLIEESHLLGRLFDIDIYSEQGIPLSRTEISFSRRSCLLCGLNATLCNRSMSHSVEDILKVINVRIKNYGESHNESC